MLKDIVKKHRFIAISSAVSLVLGVSGSVAAIWSLKSLNTPLVLHFNNYAGINSTGDIDIVWGMAIFVLILIVGNFFIALEVDKRDVFLGKLVSAATFFATVLIFIAFMVIMNVN